MATVPSSRGAGNLPNVDNAPPRFLASPDKYAALNDLILDSGSFGDNFGKPEVRELLIQTYGDQGITGFLKLTGATKSAGSSDQVEWFEAGRRHKTIDFTGVAASSNKAVFTTGADDAGVAAQFQKQDVLMDADKGTRFIVDSTVTDAGSGTDGVGTTITCIQLDGANFTVAAASNGSGGAGTLIHIGNMYAQGTDQPSKFMEPEVKRRNNTYMIVKDRYQVNGSQATNLGYINIGNGDYRWFMHGEQEARRRFEDRREMMLLLAEKHDGANDVSPDLAGSEGYFTALENRGINVSGAHTAPLSLANFDDIIIELDKQGAPAEYAMYLNRKQDLAIDDMLAAGIATQTTAGLAGQFGAFNNSADLAVQLGFKSFTRGGYTFHKHDWKLLNDPTLLGASNEYQGAMIPMTQVVDSRSGAKAPALEMCYKAANGYSRELEHWVTGGGVMGHTNGDAGNDSMTFHYRSEINLITRAANQHVLIKE